MIGETIKGFRITGRLGEGGMGEVWAAQQPIVETKVAIKFLLPQLSKDEQFVQRFFNEARAVSLIKHAGIVRIHDVGFHNDSAFLIMELLEGETLADRIRRSGRLPLPQVADIGRQIASVLGATHAVGITHRDLKPDNVFLVPDAELASGERVKVLDFGIAKVGGMGTGTRTGAAMGTPGYMAPEQWLDAGKADAASDVYSIGCIVFEMCAGRVPLVATTFPEAYAKHAFEIPPRARSLVGDLPPLLDDVIAAALAKQPAERPTVAALHHVFTELGVLVGGPPGPGFPAGASQSYRAQAVGTPAELGPPTQPNQQPHHTALLPQGHAPVGPTVPIRRPVQPGAGSSSKLGLWLALIAVVVVAGGVAVAVLATRSSGGPPAGDATARLAAATKALAGFGDPAPPASCAPDAAAESAELVLKAREAMEKAPEQALALADQSIQKCANAAAHNARGTALKKAKKLVEAGEAYGQALVLAPDYDAARTNLGITQLQSKDAAAIATFTEVLKRKPDAADVLKLRGQAYASTGQFAEAIPDLEAGLSREPSDGRGWLLLAQLREKTGKGDAHEAYCKANQLGEAAAAAKCTP